MNLYKKIGPFLNSLNENVSSELETETILHILNLKIDEKMEELHKEKSDEKKITSMLGELKSLNWVKDILKDFEKTNESLNENNDQDYKEYFRNKMEEFGVDSPSDISNDQWEDINRGWVSEDEQEDNNYHTIFRNKMEEFGVDSPSDMTKDQWDEIDNLWKTDEE